MKLRLVSPLTCDECRCRRCNKLLAKVKSVDTVAIIEIKCTRRRCGIVNVFKIERNPDFIDHEHSEGD